MTPRKYVPHHDNLSHEPNFSTEDLNYNKKQNKKAYKQIKNMLKASKETAEQLCLQNLFSGSVTSFWGPNH